MKNWKSTILIAATLAIISNAPAAHAQSTPPPPNSAQSSPRSVGDVIDRCSAAVDELKASRVLIDTLDAENASLKSRLETEKRTTAILTELNETRKSESEALRKAIDSKNETIAARDAVITTQDKLIDALKTKKPSPWRRLGDILIGAAAIAVLK